MHRIKTNTMIRHYTVLLVVSLVLCFSGSAIAQDQGDDSRSNDAAQANNPLANFTAFNLQNYYIPERSGPTDTTANNFILRYAKPFGSWLMHASLPFSRVPVGTSETVSGMGDLDVFFAYLFDTGNPAKSFGIGPQVVLIPLPRTQQDRASIRPDLPLSISIVRRQRSNGGITDLSDRLGHCQ